jgi:hypothetical protein
MSVDLLQRHMLQTFRREPNVSGQNHITTSVYTQWTLTCWWKLIRDFAWLFARLITWSNSYSWYKNTCFIYFNDFKLSWYLILAKFLNYVNWIYFFLSCLLLRLCIWYCETYLMLLILSLTWSINTRIYLMMTLAGRNVPGIKSNKSSLFLCATSAFGDEPRRILRIIRRFGRHCSCHLQYEWVTV